MQQDRFFRDESELEIAAEVLCTFHFKYEMKIRSEKNVGCFRDESELETAAEIPYTFNFK